MNRRLLALCVSALISHACQGATPAHVEAPISNAATSIPAPILPTATFTPTVLFADDFANPSANWTTGDDDGAKVGFENGAFRIFVKIADNIYWSILNGTFTDTRMDVDAAKVAGPDSAGYGVICRYSGSGTVHSFYSLTIAGNQSAAIIKTVNGEQTRLTAPDLRSTSINGANASNHFTAECIGNRLALYVNGTEIASVLDDSLTEGNIGLIALTFDEAGIDIRFDNFVAVQP